MPRLTDEELAAILQQELAHAEGDVSGDSTDELRRLALAYYNLSPRGDEKPGRSGVISSDVADMTEAVLAQLTPMLTDASVSFTALGKDDEQSAEVETELVGDQIFQENDGYTELVTATKDALLMRNTIMRARVEVDEESHTHWYRRLDPDTVGAALQPQSSAEEYPELLSQEWVDETPEGVPLYDIEVRRTWRHEKLKVAAVAPEHFRLAADHRDLSLEGVRFCAELMPMERGKLLEEGIDRSVVDELPAYTTDTTMDRLERTPGVYTDHEGGVEWSTELVEIWDSYIRVDVDDDGIAEQWRCWYGANNTVIWKEQVPFPPYCSGTCLIRGHTWQGVALSERLFNVQDIKTAVLRQWLDNLALSNNPRPSVLENQVNLSDLADSAPGGWVRVKSENALTYLQPPDVGPSAAGALEYADKMRSERGGAALDLQTAEAAIAGHTAHGTERQYSSREQLAGMMARTLAETTLRGLYLLVHRVMRTHLSTELELKVKGEWQRADPRTWRERSKLEIHVGLSQTDRDRRKETMLVVINQQTQALQMGADGVLVGLPEIHSALVDYLDACGIPAPSRYWIDPQSPAAREAAKRKAADAQAAEAEEAAQAAALLEASVGFEEYKVRTQAQTAAADRQAKTRDEDLDREVDWAKLRLDAEVKETELTLQAMQGGEESEQESEAAD